MWIVRLALRRPYTFLVGALLILLAAPLLLRKAPVDGRAHHGRVG